MQELIEKFQGTIYFKLAISICIIIIAIILYKIILHIFAKGEKLYSKDGELKKKRAK